MVGGIVVETIVLSDKVWVNCQRYSEKENKKYSEQCAIYVELTPQARCITEGDIVWWQGETAMWTPRNDRRETVGRADIPIKRIGFSGVKRPEGH